MIGLYNTSAAVSMLGLFFAVLLCAFAMAGQFELAVPCLILAGVCDFFDGAVARRLKVDARASAFGVELDSIVDMACFGLAPLVLAFAAGMSGPLAWVVGAAYACAAAQRLANFNVSGLDRRPDGTKYYTGLPVTYAALIFPVFFTVRRLTGLDAQIWMLAAYLSTAIAFVTPVPIRKPGGRAYTVFPVLALLLSSFWLLERLRRG